MKTMNRLKIAGGALSNLALTGLAVVLGGGDAAMAAAADLPDAGKTDSGAMHGVQDADGKPVPANNLPGHPDGIGTLTQDLEEGDAEYIAKAIDSRITKIRPMSTPIDQISRAASKQVHVDSFTVKYYSVGTRPMKCKLNTAVTAQTAGASVKLDVADPKMFTIDDTIRVVGVKGVYDYDGVKYENKKKYQDNPELIPDLVLCVCGRNSEDSMPIVYAVNGNQDSDGQSIWLPAISSGVALIRMGKACGELDAQTGRFNNIPRAETNYCQNFMVQIEQSTFDKIARKEVNWDFSDLEEDGIYDMRLAQEESYLFGVKNMIKHVMKDGMATWFTGGIWYQAGQDLTIGHTETVDGVNTVKVDDEDLVDFSKELFVGTGVGGKRKLLFCGSELLAALSKIESDKFRLKDTVEVWNLQFKSWITDFGEILTVHHELFDQNDMADCGFALDPEYLTKATHVNWSRNILDLKKAGIRNTDAVVLQEVACLYLRYAKAHARVHLVKAA